MNASRLLCILCIILTVCCLFACSTSHTPSDTATGADDVTAPQTVPSVPLILSHSITDITDTLPNTSGTRRTPYSMTAGINAGSAYMQNGTLYVYSSHSADGTPDPCLIPFTKDGVLDTANAIPVPRLADTNAFYAYRTQKGTFLQLHPTSDDAAEYAITVTDSAGTVLATEIYGDEFRIDPKQAPRCDYIVSEGTDGNVSVLFGNGDLVMEYTYDAAANTILKGAPVYLAEIEAFSENRFLTFSVTNAVSLGDGRYLSQGDAGAFSPATVLDVKTGALTPCPLSVPDEYTDMTVLYAPDGTYYLASDAALFRYTENEEPKRVLDFVECGIQPELPYFAALWSYDEQTFYLSMTDPADISGAFRFFFIQTELVPDTDLRQVIEITSFSEDEWLQNACAQFNRENELYKIVLETRPLSAYLTNERKLSDDIEELILYDTNPDMLILGSLAGSQIERFYDKNTFLDLTPYLPDTVLGCAASAMEYNGAQYAIPTSMAFETFVCLPETCDGTLTWKSFFEVIDSLADTEILTSTPYVRYTVYENGIMDFFDPAAKASYYDSPEFADVIQYTSKLEEYIDEGAGQFLGNTYTAPDLPARISGGNLKFLNVPLHEITTLSTLQLLFGDRQVIWCGYPARDDSTAEIDARNVVSVFGDTDVRDGCIAFLTFLLSDGQQTQEMQFLPVTKPAMRACIEEIRYAYYDTQTVNAIRNASGTLTEAGIPCAPYRTSKTPLNREDAFGSTFYADEAGEMKPQTYEEVFLSDEAIDAFLSFLDTCRMKSNADAQVLDIVSEELSYWEEGVGTLSDAAKKIQSRVQIYLQE